MLKYVRDVQPSPKSNSLCAPDKRMAEYSRSILGRSGCKIKLFIKEGVKCSLLLSRERTLMRRKLSSRLVSMRVCEQCPCIFTPNAVEGFKKEGLVLFFETPVIFWRGENVSPKMI